MAGSRQGTPEASEGSHAPPELDGAEGNERLTAMTGAVLLIGLAVECYTILRIGRLLTLHVFLGMLLLGPVVLKAGSVLYRFVRYYTGSEPYRRKGPPALLLRVIGPIIMLLTACVFGSGIMLAVTGPGYGPPSGWLEVHRISLSPGPSSSSSTCSPTCRACRDCSWPRRAAAAHSSVSSAAAAPGSPCWLPPSSPAW